MGLIYLGLLERGENSQLTLVTFLPVIWGRSNGYGKFVAG